MWKTWGNKWQKILFLAIRGSKWGGGHLLDVVKSVLPYVTCHQNPLHLKGFFFTFSAAPISSLCGWAAGEAETPKSFVVMIIAIKNTLGQKRETPQINSFPPSSFSAGEERERDIARVGESFHHLKVSRWRKKYMREVWRSNLAKF